MEITQTIQEEKKPLPPIIKQSSTYKLFVPRKVEAKIRYLIRKFPHTEWSGILFIKHSGSFEGNDLEIHCEDIFPMDLGTSGWTEFKMTEDVTAYMAENIELFDCDLALIHSHHVLGAFFSGQDINTLQSEGNDTNCFVSLIVDTPGNYVAAITRKVLKKTEVTIKDLGSSYQFFGEGPLCTDNAAATTPVTTTKEEAVIEYFMLDVQRETVDNPFNSLDKRFDEIQAKKNQAASQSPITDKTYPKWPYKNPLCTIEQLEADDKPVLRDTSKDKEQPKQLNLFSDKEMADMVDINEDEVHQLVCQMLTCSLIISKDFNLESWIEKHMNDKYRVIFPTDDMFDSWKEFIVEFIMNKYDIDYLPDEMTEEYDELRSSVAEAFYDELCKYPENDYIIAYKDTLLRYI